jgi:hypothetical protein
MKPAPQTEQAATAIPDLESSQLDEIQQALTEADT